MNTILTRRVAGMTGMAGALLLFCGDMLLYGHFGPAEGFAEGMRATVLGAGPIRLLSGGLVGPIAAAMCCFGYWHVYMNVRSTAAVTGRIMFGAFVLFAVAGGTFHSLATESELGLKYCGDLPGPCQELRAAIRMYASNMYVLASIPGYLAALLLAYLTLSGKTHYPRWAVAGNPALLILMAPFLDSTPAPLGAIVVGGYINICLALFFVLSISTTWRDSEAAHGNTSTS